MKMWNRSHERMVPRGRRMARLRMEYSVSVISIIVSPTIAQGVAEEAARRRNGDGTHVASVQPR